MYTSAYQVGNDCFYFRKEEETKLEACGSSSRKVFMKKPPSKLPMGSPVLVIIQPTDEGAYQLPTWPYPLDYQLLQHLLFSFLDTAKAAANAQLKVGQVTSWGNIG